VVTSAYVSVKALPHASVAVATAKTGVAGQLMVAVAGSGAITGGVTSCTLMVCEAVEEFPQRSVAVQVLVTLYSPAQSPGIITSVDDNVKAPPHASATVTENEGMAGQLIVVGPGNGEMAGPVVSCTAIVWDAVALFPHASVAVQVLVTLYSLGQSPGVVTSVWVSTKALPQTSVTEGVVNTGTAGQ
jgi:hypothetical protein